MIMCKKGTQKIVSHEAMATPLVSVKPTEPNARGGTRLGSLSCGFHLLSIVCRLAGPPFGPSGFPSAGVINDRNPSHRRDLSCHRGRKTKGVGLENKKVPLSTIVVCPLFIESRTLNGLFRLDLDPGCQAIRERAGTRKKKAQHELHEKHNVARAPELTA
jgi:hypothetical protein